MWVVIFYNEESGFCICNSQTFKKEKEALKYAKDFDKKNRGTTHYTSWKIFDLEND